MSQYPVENGDTQALAEAVNYLLSGPGGLGQNFSGFSSYIPAWLTGNFRIPFSQQSVYKDAVGVSGEFTIEVANNDGLVIGQSVTGNNIGAGAVITNISDTIITLSVANSGDVNESVYFYQLAELYVAPIPLSNAEQLDDRTIKYTFSGGPLASAPFSLGNGLTVTGITPSTYNSASLSAAGTPITQIGVVECTTTFVIVRTRDPITTPLGTYVSGGDISYTSMNTLNSTDCDVRVTVTGATDRVFISAQLDEIISYEVGGSTEDLTVYVDITRYQAFPNNNPTNPDYIFDNAVTVTEKVYEFTGLTGSGTLPLIETVFATLVDEPDPGYYRYILEVYFTSSGSNLQVVEDELILRSISAQVVKQ